jgi:hypothetical protein
MRGFEIRLIQALRRYTIAMNVRPAPAIPGDTEAERMDNAVRQVFTVSKEEIQRREAEWKKTKQGKVK